MTVKIFFPDRLLSLSFAFFVSPLIFEVDLQVSYSRPLRWFLALHGFCALHVRRYPKVNLRLTS